MGLAKFKLVVLAGPKAGAEYELPEGVLTLGRGADNAISIPDVSVSRKHVRLEREGPDAVRVTDLNSGNGTPTTGNTPATIATLITTCQKTIDSIPKTSNAPKRSLARSTSLRPYTRKAK